MDAYEKPQTVKMHAPRFDGSDATNWVSRVNYYFDHLMMPDAQRLHYAVMLFDPPASEWVFNYCTNNDFVTWQDFLEDVRHRFDRQSFKDYFGLIAKLTQTGSVEDYHDTFEKYLNRVHGIPEKELFILFIAGLKADMQERLRLHRPASLAEAMALALELATTQPDRHQTASSFQRKPWQPRDNRVQSGTTPTPPTAQPQTGASGPGVPRDRATAPPRPQLIRVSQAEKAERSRLGLCWHCPEKWVMGHVCKQRLLCYADDPEFSDGADCENAWGSEKETEEVAHVHALNDRRRSRPLRVVGTIQDREVDVLIDTGSDRDFLHPRIAELLHLPLSPIRPFRVIVGNGETLLCTHISRQTKLVMQGTIFSVDLHILEVHGPDVILGMEWLESLGKVTADFAGKSLEFFHENKSVILKGITPPQHAELICNPWLPLIHPEGRWYYLRWCSSSWTRRRKGRMAASSSLRACRRMS